MTADLLVLAIVAAVAGPVVLLAVANELRVYRAARVARHGGLLRFDTPAARAALREADE